MWMSTHSPGDERDKLERTVQTGITTRLEFQPAECSCESRERTLERWVGPLRLDPPRIDARDGAG